MDMNIKPKVALNITPESNVQQQASQKWLCIIPASQFQQEINIQECVEYQAKSRS